MRYKYKSFLNISIFLLSLSYGYTLAITPASKPVIIKLTLQEAQIIQQVLQQIDLTTQEVAPYLEISKPLEQLLDTTESQGVDPAGKEVILRLPVESASNLLLFIQRANIPALGAKQIDKIIKKVEKSLPKGTLPERTGGKKREEVTLQLTTLEALVTQQLLTQIEIGVSEVEPFLAIYLPLEQGTIHAREHGQEKEVIIKLPEVGPSNLLLFMERARITGQQAKVVYGIVEKLQHLVRAISASHNEDSKDKVSS